MVTVDPVTHIAKECKGKWRLTYCGVMIQKGTEGTNPPAVISSQSWEWWDKQALVAYNGFCPVCIAAGGGHIVETILRSKVKGMDSIHVKKHIVKDIDTTTQKMKGQSMVMLCGQSWDLLSLWNNRIGFFTREMLKGEIENNMKICKECLEHPDAQLVLLDVTEI